MCATMARQGGRVQLELSDMRVALNMLKMAKGGFSRDAIEETHHLIKKPLTAVQEEKMRGVKYPGCGTVPAVMERYPAMLWETHTGGCLPFQNCTAQHPQTGWRWRGMGAPAPERLRQPTPEPTPHPPGTRPVPPSGNEGDHASEIEGVPPGYAYIHTPPSSARFFILNAYAKVRKRNKDSIQSCWLMLEYALVSTQSATW